MDKQKKIKNNTRMMNSWTKMNVLLNVYISNTDRKRNVYKIGWTNQTQNME